MDSRKRRRESEASKRKIVDAQKFADEKVVQATGALAAAGGGALAGMGVDAFTGEAGTFNSGELGLNALNSVAMLGTGAIGGYATGSAINANIGKSRTEKFDQEKRKPRNDSQGVALGSNSDYNRFAKDYRKDRKGGMSKEDAIVRESARQSTRNLRGAAIGAAAMLVPTLMSMADRETLANQSASLM